MARSWTSGSSQGRLAPVGLLPSARLAGAAASCRRPEAPNRRTERTAAAPFTSNSVDRLDSDGRRRAPRPRPRRIRPKPRPKAGTATFATLNNLSSGGRVGSPHRRGTVAVPPRLAHGAHGSRTRTCASAKWTTCTRRYTARSSCSSSALGPRSGHGKRVSQHHRTAALALHRS